MPKKYSFFSLLLSSTLKKISQIFSDIADNISGSQQDNPVDNFPIANISPKIRSLINNLFREKIIRKIVKMSRVYHDEPWTFHYQAETPNALPEISFYSDGRGSGLGQLGWGDDVEEERALIKAVAEGLERFCLSVYREKNLLLSPYNKISKKALNPLSFAGISPLQRQANPKLKIDENSLFRWVEGFSLFDKKKVLIPAQLVYIGYQYHPQEPFIQEQISTGAAAGDSFEGALYGGICEAVERDAFMITYFNKLSPPLIDLGSINDERLKNLLLNLKKRYNLELYLIDITTDVDIPTVLAVLIDRTGIGPAVMLGLDTSLDIREAIWGSLYEVLKGRINFREVVSSSAFKEKRKEIKLNPFQIRTFVDRCLFWSSPEMIEKINFLFRGPRKRISKEQLKKHQNISSKEKLKTVLELLKESKIDAYLIDVTLPRIKQEGLWIIKVVSSHLHPLYLCEATREIWGERMFYVPVKLGYREKPSSEKELNSLPHPFL